MSARSRTWDTSCETFCHGPPELLGTSSLGWAEYAQNSLRQSSTGLTPFQCVLGSQGLPCFPWSGEPSNVPAVDYCSERARESGTQLTISCSRQCADKDAAERPTISQSRIPTGQKVWLSHETSSCICLAGSSVPDSLAPFTILEQINPVTYKLQLPPTLQDSPYLPCVTTQTLLSFCFPRAWPDRRAPSPSHPGRRSHCRVKDILESRLPW